MKKIFVIQLLVLLSLGVWGQDLQPIPPLNSPVTDLTGTLSSAEARNLDGALRNFAQQKGSQVVVLMIPTTDPEDIASYGIRVAEEWKIGREGVDDGVILIVAKEDRELRIEVGYGLEGAIPDAYAKRIIENIILPEFRNGQFYDGIADGVGAIMGLIEGEELPAVTQAQGGDQMESPFRDSLALLMIVTFIGISIIKALVKNKGAKAVIAIIIAVIIGFLFANVALFVISLVLSLLLMFANGGRGRGGGGIYYGGGFGGGGFGGGGFGGFSGGGGGFGGGGASGSW